MSTPDQQPAEPEAGPGRGGSDAGPGGPGGEESDVRGGAPVVVLEAWDGPWAADDPDANFKADIALYGRTDPLSTITNLANAIDVPVGALVRYVLAKWASEGSGGLLEIGPRMTRRLHEPFVAAEEAGTDEARLAAYDQVRQMVAWLNIPLDQPDVYPE